MKFSIRFLLGLLALVACAVPCFVEAAPFAPLGAMIILPLTAGNVHGGTVTFEVEKPISHILLEINYADADAIAYAVATTTTDNILNAAQATITLTRRNGDNVRIMTQAPLALPVEFLAYGEGYVRIDVNAAGTFVNKVLCMIPIGVDGAVNMSQDETIRATITGLRTTSTSNITIYGIESYVLTSDVYQFNNLSVPNGQTEKDYDMNGFDFVVLPATAALMELRLMGTNGTVVVYTPRELAAIVNNSNDIVFSTNRGLNTSGYSNYYIISVDMVKKITVTTNNAGYQFYGVKTDPAVKPSEAANANAGLYSTTDAQRALAVATAESR